MYSILKPCMKMLAHINYDSVSAYTQIRLNLTSVIQFERRACSDWLIYIYTLCCEWWHRRHLLPNLKQMDATTIFRKPVQSRVIHSLTSKNWERTTLWLYKITQVCKQTPWWMSEDQQTLCCKLTCMCYTSTAFSVTIARQ